MNWEDGYWCGELVDGYPSVYFEGEKFKYPWEKEDGKEIGDYICHCDRIGEVSNVNSQGR